MGPYQPGRNMRRTLLHVLLGAISLHALVLLLTALVPPSPAAADSPDGDHGASEDDFLLQSSRLQSLRDSLMPPNCIQAMPWSYFKPGKRTDLYKNGTPFNFGDELNIDLGSWLFGVPRETSPERIGDHSALWVGNSNRRSKIVCIGSVMRKAKPGDVVAGPGYYKEHGLPSGLKSDKTSIVSVRGPVSCQNMQRHGIKCPDVQIDPAMFSRLLIWPELKRQDTPEFPVCIIPHYVDAESITRARELELEGKVKMIEVWEPLPRTVAEQVVKCGRVISSSLHGIIIADAFSVPAVWLHAPSLTAYLDKFEDHFQSVGRYPGIQPVHTIDEGILASPMDLIDEAEVAHQAEMWLKALPYGRICE